MQVYGALFLPVLFAILFELNLAAFVANRINYSVSCAPIPRHRLPDSQRHKGKS